jgi:DNA-binding NarL/FixJ family response regulator
MSRIRIVIADDHTLVAEAIKNLIEPEYEVVKMVADGRSLVDAAVELKPDIVLQDLGMPLLNGFDAGERLKKLLPRTKFIVLTVNEESYVAAKALRQFANGYLLKKSAAGELKKAISAVLLGESYVTPIIAKKLTADFIRDPNPDRVRKFTSRQREVLQLLAEGRSMKQVAATLHITPRTVAFHKYRVMEEFGLKTNADLVQFAFRERLVEVPNNEVSVGLSRMLAN